MDIILLLLLVLAVLVILGAVFAFVRRKQRSGSVLATPDAFGEGGGS